MASAVSSKVSSLTLSYFARATMLQGITAPHWPRIVQVVMEVHDIDVRLAQICGLLRDEGFYPLVVEQGASLRAFGVHQPDKGLALPLRSCQH